MSERKLVTVDQIKSIKPIIGADSIECVYIKSWPVVVMKDEYKVGDLVLYYEIDSYLPIREEYEFLRKSSYKQMPDGTEGFRLRTIKLRGQVSQGLIMPINLLNNVYDGASVIEVGMDVTELMKVTKYERPIPECLLGIAIGEFPTHTRKSNEERIQNFEEKLKSLTEIPFLATEKLEGINVSFFLKDDEFGVCSHGLQLIENENNPLWNQARKYNIEEKLRSYGKNITIQGELVGNSMQGNIYKFNHHDVYFFDVFDIDLFDYYTYDQAMILFNTLELKMVPLIYEELFLPTTVNEILLLADGKSKLNPDTNREGLIFRTKGSDRTSFKAISNNYLLKQK